MLLFPQSSEPSKTPPAFTPDPSWIPPESVEPPDLLAQMLTAFEGKPESALEFPPEAIVHSVKELAAFAPELVLVAVKAHSVLTLRRQLAGLNALTVFIANGFWMHPGMDLGVLLAGGLGDGNRLSYGQGGTLLLGRVKSPHSEFLLAFPERGGPGALVYNLHELERLETLVEAMDPEFLRAEIDADIYPQMLQKAIVNCLVNPLSAASGEVNGVLLEPWVHGLVEPMLDEILSVLRSASFLPADEKQFAKDALLDEFEEVCRATYHNRSSMQVDVLRGRPTELLHLSMLVVNVGERYGIPCPVNRTVSEMVVMALALREPL